MTHRGWGRGSRDGDPGKTEQAAAEGLGPGCVGWVGGEGRGHLLTSVSVESGRQDGEKTCGQMGRWDPRAKSWLRELRSFLMHKMEMVTDPGDGEREMSLVLKDHLFEYTEPLRIPDNAGLSSSPLPPLYPIPALGL